MKDIIDDAVACPATRQVGLLKRVFQPVGIDSRASWKLLYHFGCGKCVDRQRLYFPVELSSS
jgi:hypothetical protein